MNVPRVDSKRVLVTGLATYWGGRLAQRLEKDPAIDVIVGVDSRDPRVELERTEFVRVGTQHALIRRIIDAAEIDTVIDTRLVVDSIWTSSRAAHENNVIGTMNIVTACDGRESPVRKLIFKSAAHWYGCERDDPAFFTESMSRPHPPHTPIERDIVEAEASLRDFAERNRDKTVTVLRFANTIGPTITTSHTRLFSLPAVPCILGFDPRYQFVHEDDVVGILHHAVREDLHGIFNGAADGVLAFSEVVGLLGKRLAPVLPPWGTGVAAGPLNRLGLRIPVEMLNQLRYGRGLDNRKLKGTGFRYRHTTREAVQAFAEHLRVRPLKRSAREPYRYEREVEEFLRWSPHVRSSRAPEDSGLTRAQLAELRRLLIGDEEPAKAGQDAAAPAPQPDKPARAPRPRRVGAPVDHYDDLGSEEVISLLGSLDPQDLHALRGYEEEHQAREPVLGAIDSVLARI
ncbi:MAG TPA: NAD-dependent epimerase/dehydratase family protein, partial [Solirubrobacteraceae bacterium]|nr:NAD-dependent epimerase/dehydratase family protein [Solirubrobacteraceae bacterium]